MGGGLPVAVGLALSDRLAGRARVTACFFGDGAVDEGEFHESLNLAALWKLPVLFVCENNGYAMGTALARHRGQTDLGRTAEGEGVPARAVDGMDWSALATAAGAAAAAVRRDGPLFLEARTYRYRAHSMSDPDLYRDKAEIEAWKRRDPIEALAARLRAEHRLDDAARARIEADAAREIEAAVAFAEAGPLEPVEALTAGVCTA